VLFCVYSWRVNAAIIRGQGTVRTEGALKYLFCHPSMTRALFYSAFANDHQLRSHKAQRLLWLKDLSTPGPGRCPRCLLAISGTGKSLVMRHCALPLLTSSAASTCSTMAQAARASSSLYHSFWGRRRAANNLRSCALPLRSSKSYNRRSSAMESELKFQRTSTSHHLLRDHATQTTAV